MAQSMEERLKAKKAKNKAMSEGGKYFTIKEGTLRVRPVPILKEQEFSLEVVFFFLGQELGGVISPATFGKKCALMQQHLKMKESKKESDRKFAKESLKPGRKAFSLVYKYKDEKGKEIDKAAGVKPILLTPGLVNSMIDLYLDSAEAGDFTSKKRGYDLKFTREGKGMTDTRYDVRACKPTALNSKFEGPYDLEAAIKEITPSYEETKDILEKFMNIGSKDDDSSDDSDRKDKKKKKKKNRDL